MSEQPTGLRFDIYERVQLSERITGVKEWEEIEMTPFIQMVSEGDQATLKGNLVLEGKYVGDDDTRDIQKLEYFIPVEITLPMNRIQRLEDISIEVENLDVDLLSNRSMNVTGVLLLRGVEMVSVIDEPWREEGTVFQHDAAQSYQVFDELEPVNMEVHTSTISDNPWLIVKEAKVLEPEPVKSVNFELIVPEAQVSGEVDVLEVNLVEAVTEELEEKKQPKVAFGIKSLLGKWGVSDKWDSRSNAGISTEAAISGDSNASVLKPSGDDLEWKKLFLSSSREDKSFRKVRMCIVQKQETIDTIAGRYSLKPREILLFNKLQSSDVSEGQIIYIP